MFDWQDSGRAYQAISDRGNVYLIAPVDHNHPEGPWLCEADMVDGTNYAPRTCEDRQRAEGYAEELEIQFEE